MTESTNGPAFEPSRRLIDGILRPLKESFVGKDEIIDLLGICLVAGENLFLLGPPGTAKSAVVQELAKRLDGRVFDYLLTRFTEPNELFGPFDIRRLREGELITNTEGMLPEAAVVFLDELFNANSAILNSLLTVLNERVFRRGRETRRLPTLMVVGASNRLPEDEALGALFDRFLVRVRCDNVPTEHLQNVLAAGWQLDTQAAPASATMTTDQIRELQFLLRNVDLSAVRGPLGELVQRLRHAGLAVSDRRAVKLQRIIAASALLCGRLAAQISDLWVVRHIWDTEEQVEVLQALVNDALKRGDSAGERNSHPRARGDSGPDPESLARDLERMAQRLGEDGLADHERSFLGDQLGILAGRCPWVQDEQKRTFLQTRVDELWQRLGGRK
jgi:MoxR-like ATPase